MNKHEKMMLDRYKGFCDYCRWYKKRFGYEYEGAFIIPDEIAAEKEIERYDREDKQCRCDWDGQYSADENYEGTFDVIIIR